jgi:hypothetical protein
LFHIDVPFLYILASKKYQGAANGRDMSLADDESEVDCNKKSEGNKPITVKCT